MPAKLLLFYLWILGLKSKQHQSCFNPSSAASLRHELQKIVSFVIMSLLLPPSFHKIFVVNRRVKSIGVKPFQRVETLVGSIIFLKCSNQENVVTLLKNLNTLLLLSLADRVS